MAHTATVLINAVDVTVRIVESNISDIINNQVNTFDFRITGAPPVAGQPISITVNTNLIFNGYIDHTSYSFVGKGVTANLQTHCTAMDDAFRLDQLRPFGTFAAVSATTVVTTIVGTYGSGITTTNVAASLAAVTITLDGTQTMSAALSAIAALIGGYWYVENGDLHFFITEASASPDTINDANPPLQDTPITMSTDISQLRTRVYGKGGGSSLTTDVASGVTSLPIGDISVFNTGGGKALVGSDIVTYTGTQVDTSGSILSWKIQTPPATVNRWTAVAYAPSINTLCAIALSNSAGIMTSTDGGLNWTNRTPSTTADWFGIAWSSSLSLFCVVGLSNNAMTSPDGITWTNRALSITGKTWGIAWSPTLALFAIVSSGTNGIMTSPDGITWTGRTLPNSVANYGSGIWADTIGLFVFPGVNLGGVSARGFITSPDGITWSQQNGITVGGFNGVCWSHELGLLVASPSGTSNMAWSLDAVTWHLVNVPPNGNWSNVTWSAELGLFLSIISGSVTDSIQTLISYDGKTWTGQPGPLNSNAWGNRGLLWLSQYSWFVAVSNTSTAGAQAATAVLATTVSGSLTGVSGVTVSVAAGVSVSVWVQRDDAAAQAVRAAIEGGTGIHEFLVSDSSLTEAELTALCDANLDAYSAAIVTVVYSCLDYKSKSGKTIIINLTTPAISQTLIIQSVKITRIANVPNQPPVFTVTASTIRNSIEDIFQRLLAGLQAS